MQRKIDPGSIVGFVIIGALLIWMLYNNSNKPTPPPAPEKTEAAAPSPALPEAAPATPAQSGFATDSLLAGAEEKIIVLENDVLSLKISSKGGQAVEALLKSFKTYEDKPLYLIKDGNASMGFEMLTKDNRIIRTKDLIFEPQLDASDNGVKTLTLSVSPQANKTLKFVYTVKPGEYVVDFHVYTQGFYTLLDASRPISLLWEMKTLRQDKSITYENRYTILSYRHEGRVDELSASGEDDETQENVNWVAFRQHFFNSILIADKPFSSAELSSKNLATEESKTARFTKAYQSALKIEPENGELSQQLHWYFGPTDYKVLSAYDDTYDISDSLYLGWGIFGWLNKYVFIPLFSFLCRLVPHGVAIILLTIIVRILMSPATYKSYVSQAKMKVIQPEVAEINEKYKGKENTVKRQQEVMALYRKAGVNPMSGCIPALLQLPVFYALFAFFPTAFVLRQKSFLWATDLSSYDTVLELPFNIPFYGAHISLFPILASVAIFFYMKLTTGQSVQQTQPGMPNMKFLMYLSPIMMLFFFNNYASGLSLYYFISNLITIFIMLVIKHYIINEQKIHDKIQENKKSPKAPGKFQRKMQELMEQAEKNKKKPSGK